ncbi:cupin domain-containing protein [Acinetobacter pittii]|uniref:cupin domain-containing protein n=1 Tax=Acinetobacter pittii TaxID=48296 RepID=UPI003266E82C
MNLNKIQRVVTGHNQKGEAIILYQGETPNVKELAHAPGTFFHEIWHTTSSTIHAQSEDVSLDELMLPPPQGGSRIRFVDIPPDHEYLDKLSSGSFAQAFEEIGSQAASTAKQNSPHPLMHRTESVDYGIVMQGTITLVLDQEEIEISQGGVIVQRGTNHAWANKTNEVCRLAFILIDAEYEPALKEQLDNSSI